MAELQTEQTPFDRGPYRVPDAVQWPEFVAEIDALSAQAGWRPPLPLATLESAADAFLETTGRSADYRAFTMVMLHNACWRETVRSVQPARRTLLLPPCLRDSAQCPAAFDEYGLLCEACGRCCIGSLSALAEDLGYAVLVAEGTGVVSRLLERGAVDSVIGVSCMASLERTFQHMSRYAVPGLAIPLLQDGCTDTQVPLAYVEQALRLMPREGDVAPVDIRSLRKQVAGWFEPAPLHDLVAPHDSPVDEISMAWLARDGKRWRPLLVVSLYEAFAGCLPGDVPETVQRVAVAVECIHKGSLVYDDIQDGDGMRYGEATVHQAHGVPMALTCALQLIGRGYKLISESGAEPAIVQRLLALATTGHVDLCVGQGADVGWLREPRALSSEAVLEMFRWKTAPSFEVVFLLGAILAGADSDEEARVREFSCQMGVAYQIRDDLTDWDSGGDVDDILMGRPCLMSALAAELSPDGERERVIAAWLRGGPGDAACIRSAIAAHGVEVRARELLDRHRQKAFDAIEQLESRNAKILLHRLGWRMLQL